MNNATNVHFSSKMYEDRALEIDILFLRVHKRQIRVDFPFSTLYNNIIEL
jgi:hypothetical protein